VAGCVVPANTSVFGVCSLVSLERVTYASWRRSTLIVVRSTFCLCQPRACERQSLLVYVLAANSPSSTTWMKIYRINTILSTPRAVPHLHCDRMNIHSFICFHNTESYSMKKWQYQSKCANGRRGP